MRSGSCVTFVDLTKNWEAIPVNARRVGALANQLWAESAKVRPLKFIGASMGGLIVTTTAVMKDNYAAIGEASPGWSFQVDHVTTMDGSHGGVYIPEAIYHMLLRFNDLKPEAGALYKAITSVATKQMEFIPYNTDFQITHANWQTYYDRVLAAMRKSDIRFVGVVNRERFACPSGGLWTPWLNRDGPSPRPRQRGNLILRRPDRPIKGRSVFS